MCVSACVWMYKCKKRRKKRWIDRETKQYEKNVINLGDRNTSVSYKSFNFL